MGLPTNFILAPAILILYLLEGSGLGCAGTREWSREWAIESSQSGDEGEGMVAEDGGEYMLTGLLMVLGTEL